MFKKRLSSFALSLIAFFCSAFVTQSYLNRAIAAQVQKQESEISKQAKDVVLAAYPKLIDIVENGALDKSLESFSDEYVDLTAIANTICKDGEKIVPSLKKYFIARFRSEAIQKITGYNINKNMQVIDDESFVKVRAMLISKTDKTDKVQMIVTMPKANGSVKQFSELEIMSIPLSQGAKVVVQKYCSDNNVPQNADNAKTALDKYSAKILKTSN